MAACVIASMGVGAQGVPAAAPASGTLYGISFPALVNSIDPASGTLSPLAPLASVGPNPLVVALTADSRSPDLVALVGTCTVCPGPRGGGPMFWQLAKVNTETGSIQPGPVLGRPLAYSIAIDPANDQVWGLPQCVTLVCATQTVVVVDPSTAAETDVATLPVPSFFDSFVALAPKSHTLYIAIPVAGGFQLFVLNTETRVVTTGPSLGQAITGLAVDSSDGRLFATLGGVTPRVVAIDPSTGAQTVLATLNAFGLSYPTVDPRTHTLYAAGLVVVNSLGATAIVSVNDRSGAVTVGTPITGNVGPVAFQRLRGHAGDADG